MTAGTPAKWPSTSVLITFGAYDMDDISTAIFTRQMNTHAKVNGLINELMILHVAQQLEH